VLSHFRQQAHETGFAIIAYCFMPDHVHLLVEGVTVESDCKQFIKRAKQFSGFYFAKQFGERLWQRYGYERVLRNDETTLVVANYILANPLRAGLASSVLEYPFVGSLMYSIQELVEGVCRSG
jgi:putative transposase